jgi:hypothetical protein
LTALSSNDGTLSVTLTINKGTAKAAVVWLAILGGALLLFLGANIAFLSMWSKEARLATNALDEKRLENRQAWRQLGVDGQSLEDHDISEILDRVREKYPQKERKNVTQP